MGKKIRIWKKSLSSFLLYPSIAIFFLIGCASSSSSMVGKKEAGTQFINQANETSSSGEAINRRGAGEVWQPVAAEVPGTESNMEADEAGIKPSEPRIIADPVLTDLNQVRGIDFTMLEQGKSRLTITTDKKVSYNLDRKGRNALELKLQDIVIPSLLLRDIDTKHFKTAIDSIKPIFSSEKKEVSLTLFLREMVPFHIKQTENGINMDFGQTSITPPEKKLIPLNLTEAETATLSAEQPAAGGAAGGAMVFSSMPGQKKQYKGEPMYLDFVNADVTHILRLINEVSEENIIWDPIIKGRTVSMILKDVPWDEALELVLKNNELAKRYVGDNIVWITTKAKMDKIIAEEEAEILRLQKKKEDERNRLEDEKKKAKEQEPLITEYLPVDFAGADEIQGHITLTQRGTMSLDTRTNTIIIKDTAESIDEAKKIVKQFDTPVKQIMIEARIVDATDSFSRDLGLRWNENSQAWRSNRDYLTLVPPYALNEDGTSLINGGGERVYGGSFSTNSPDGWDSNIGLSFARITNNGLGAITLDASLALAETEGTAKVMSAPKVIAREGTAATISSGDSIIIPATENVASTTLDATLSLTVTPTAVSYNDFITLDVNVTDDQAPSTSRLLRKSINTTLMIKSGETVVIGGIIKESEGNDESGIPVLRDIPGLGWLFKAKSKTRSKSELLIFLTPTVLPSPAKTL